MAIVSKDVLKGYFNTGDVPTEQHFANLIESLQHSEETSDFEIVKTEGDYTLNEGGSKLYQNADAVGELNGGQVTTFNVFCNIASTIDIITFTDDLDGSVTILTTDTHNVVPGLNSIDVNFTGLTSSTLIGFSSPGGGVVKYRTGLPDGTSYSANLNGTTYESKVHEFGYWLTYATPAYSLPTKVEISTGYYTVLGSSDLQAIVDANRYVVLPDGVITLTVPLTVPNDTTIIGGRNSVLTCPAGDTSVLITGSNVTLLGFTIRGTNGGISTSATNLTTDAEITALNGVALQAGVRINASTLTEIIISGLNIENVAGSAIRIDTNGSSYSGQVSISDINISDCQIGIHLMSSGEYNNISNIKARRCWVGAAIYGGNNIVSNSNFSGNRIGMIVGAGSNNSHGSVVGCQINHSVLYGIFYSGTKGHCFIGCHTHDSDTRLYDCDGFLYNGGMVGGRFLMADCRSALMSHNFASGNLTYNPFVVVEDGGTTNDYVYSKNYNLDGTAIADFPAI